MHDRGTYLCGDLLAGCTDTADLITVDRDAVREKSRVPPSPLREGDTVVEAEQPGLRRLVFDHDSYVLHQPSELFGYAVEGVNDKLLELLPGYVHHVGILTVAVRAAACWSADP